MVKFVISISSVTILISIISLLLPEGKASNIVKFVMSLIVLSIILSPLKNLANCNFDFDLNNSQNVSAQDDFLDYYANKNANLITQDCIKICSDNGIENANATLEYEITNDYKLTIKKITLIIKKEVISTIDKHIDIIEQIKTKITNKYAVEKYVEVVYE